jgi:hypothetical protein
METADPSTTLLRSSGRDDKGRVVAYLKSCDWDVWILGETGPTQGDENGSCSAATLPGSTAFSFVISTKVMKTAPVQQLLFLEALPSPLSSRPR